jgi:putative ABC transport system permease protein
VELRPGAQRGDIVRYFLVENWLITTVGVIIGSALALVAGSWLATHYGLPRLDLYYLVGGIRQSPVVKTGSAY